MVDLLENKNIVLGITGSIAAYKAVELASTLHQSAANVDVILTSAACKFVTPLSFQSVTGRKAYIDDDLWGGQGHITHVGISHEAELLVIAPASANTIAKLAYGIGDNLLCLTALAAQCPLIIAPAMDAGMYKHPATQENVERLRQRGAYFVGPASGHLASGLTGLGRFVDPPEIIGHIRFILGRNEPLRGKKVIVTAGGTQEPIDPVRVITNCSSGKQGYAIAQAAIDQGAEVILISAPTSLRTPTGAIVVPVNTTSEMLKAVHEHIPSAEALIMAAAPADFRPSKTTDTKIKKDSKLSSIPLEPTKDILIEVAKTKKQTGFPKYVIGFAAETHDLIENATKKLNDKEVDLIVANDVTAGDSGFTVDTNRVSLLFKNGNIENLPVLQKKEVAEAIVNHLIAWCKP